MAILCSGAERFEQFWWRTSKVTIILTLVEIRPVVRRKCHLKQIVDDARWTTDAGHRAITIAHPSMLCLCELKTMAQTNNYSFSLEDMAQAWKVRVV